MDDITFKDILPAVIALAGVLLGGLIAELHALIQASRERRRALRTLLFQLLELRHQIRTRNPEELLPFIIEYIRSRSGEETAQKLNTAEVQRQLREVMKIITSIASSKPFTLEYQKAVEALAPYDPIIAYRLTGQEGLLSLDRELKLYYEKVATLTGTNLDEPQRGFMEQAQSTTLKTTYYFALDALAKKIRSVGIRISPMTWYRVNRIIRYQDKLSNKKIKEEMTRFLDKLFTDLASDANSMVV